MIELKTSAIRAACKIAPDKDVRYYLNGVRILVREDGAVHVQATDGHCAFDDLQPASSSYAPADFAIPLSVAKAIAKSKSETVTVTLASDGRYECAGQIFAPIDGKFPDVDRILPKRDAGLDDLVGHYDADILARCQAAMRIACNSTRMLFKTQNGPTGLMYHPDRTYPRCAIAQAERKAFESKP